jgi:hypothetical protein
MQALWLVCSSSLGFLSINRHHGEGAPPRIRPLAIFGNWTLHE